MRAEDAVQEFALPIMKRRSRLQRKKLRQRQKMNLNQMMRPRQKRKS